MPSQKEIIVVAPEQYWSLSRMLSHEISKQPGMNGASWTFKQFEDNEFQLGGGRYVILIGSPEENKIAKDFLPLIKNIQNRSGACFGYDGTKAVVYGEGKLEQESAITDLIIVTKEIADRLANKKGATLAAVLVAAILSTGFLTTLVSARVWYFWKSNKQKIKELKQTQTKLALTLFISESLNGWIDVPQDR